MNSVVALQDYVQLGEAYHKTAGHPGDLPNCEVDYCDVFHAVTFATEAHELIVSGYLDDLVDMYESYAEDDGLPAWSTLSQKQRDMAIDVVQQLHMDVDEYHPMADAIEGAA